MTEAAQQPRVSVASESSSSPTSGETLRGCRGQQDVRFADRSDSQTSRASVTAGVVTPVLSRSRKACHASRRRAVRRASRRQPASTRRSRRPRGEDRTAQLARERRCSRRARARRRARRISQPASDRRRGRPRAPARRRSPVAGGPSQMTRPKSRTVSSSQTAAHQVHLVLDEDDRQPPFAQQPDSRTASARRSAPLSPAAGSSSSSRRGCSDQRSRDLDLAPRAVRELGDGASRGGRAMLEHVEDRVCALGRRQRRRRRARRGAARRRPAGGRLRRPTTLLEAPSSSRTGARSGTCGRPARAWRSRCSGPADVASSPKKEIVPALAVCRPLSTLSRVVLPAPLGPMTPRICRSGTRQRDVLDRVHTAELLRESLRQLDAAARAHDLLPARAADRRRRTTARQRSTHRRKTAGTNSHGRRRRRRPGRRRPSRPCRGRAPRATPRSPRPPPRPQRLPSPPRTIIRNIWNEIRGRNSVGSMTCSFAARIPPATPPSIALSAKAWILRSVMFTPSVVGGQRVVAHRLQLPGRRGRARTASTDANAEQDDDPDEDVAGERETSSVPKRRDAGDPEQPARAAQRRVDERHAEDDRPEGERRHRQVVALEAKRDPTQQQAEARTASSVPARSATRNGQPQVSVE